MTNYVEKINDISIGGNNFDGQWTYKYQVAYQGFPTANSTLTYNLSSYLPDDNYDYEVLITGYAYTGTTTDNVIQLKVNSGSTATHNSSCLLAHKVTRTSSFNEGGSSAVIPIQKSDQKISIYFVGTYRTTSNQTRVELFGYRRVGTNSIGSSNYIENVKIPSKTLIPNTIIHGTPTITSGVASNFSASNYLDVIGGRQKNNAVYVIKFTTGNTTKNTAQTIACAEYLLSLDIAVNAWDLMAYNWETSINTHFLTLTPSTTYWIKIEINGQSRAYSYSTDGISYTLGTSFTDSYESTTENYPFRLGTHSADRFAEERAFIGSIDLNECYINVNNNRVWDGMDYINNLPIGGNIISSQWKNVNMGAIFNANYTAGTTYTINLKSSNLIPNDGYKYELLMSTWANTGATSGNYCVIRFTSNLITGSLTVYGAVTRAAATNNNGVQVVYPVAEDGILKVNFSAPSGVSQSGRVWLHGYRRLGTNE